MKQETNIGLQHLIKITEQRHQRHPFFDDFADSLAQDFEHTANEATRERQDIQSTYIKKSWF